MAATSSAHRPVVWGVGLVFDASTRFTLVDLPPTGTFIAVSPFVTGSVLGSLFAFTVVSTKRTQFWSMPPGHRSGGRAGPPRRFRRTPDRATSHILGGNEGSPPWPT